MIRKSFLCGTLASAWLLTLGPAMAQKLTKKALDMQSVPVAATPPPSPKPKPSAESGPRLTLDEFTQAKQGRLQQITDKQIAYMRRLIELASPDDPQLPDYWFRLGELLAEKYRYFEHKARSLDEAIFRAKQSGDAGTEDQQRRQQQDDQRKADQSLQKAVSCFLVVAKHSYYPRRDENLYRLGHLLELAGRGERARAIFHLLLKEHPQSRYVPEAYLSLADFFFAQGDMAQALELYGKVTHFPRSGVYGFALYKKAWTEANLGRPQAALATFAEVLTACQAGNIAPAQRGPLEKEARHDLVRMYARTPGANPDQAWAFFRRVGGEQAPRMLQSLAELYWEEGMAGPSSRVYRQAMALAPQSPLLCAWQAKVLRNALSTASEPEQVQELRRLGTTYRHLQDRGDLRPDVLGECRASYREAARELAFVLHKQAQRLKQPPTFQLAALAYRELLGAFLPQAPPTEIAFYYAECLWQTASLSGADAALWRETAEQYTRVVNLDPKGPYVKEAAYAAVLAWQNALYENDADLHRRPSTGG